MVGRFGLTGHHARRRLNHTPANSRLAVRSANRSPSPRWCSARDTTPWPRPWCCATRPARRSAIRMEPGATGNRPVARHGRRRPSGHVVVRDRGVERSDRDVAPRGHRQDRGRAGQRGPAPTISKRVRDCSTGWQGRCREPSAPVRPRPHAALRDARPRPRAPGGAGAGGLPAANSSSEYPVRDMVQSLAAVPALDRPASSRCSARGTSSSRARSARELAGDPAAPASPPGTARSRTRPNIWTTSPPWASTSCTCRRSTRSVRSTARARTTRLSRRPGTSARRGRSGRGDGGHDAIHPDLGTMADFTGAGEAGQANSAWRSPSTSPCSARRTIRGSARTRSGSPRKPDGTIAYAENPPKKYQDIYPLNFDNDPKGLYAECLRIVRHWIAAGVKIFRVDNPHTKPINFWQWLIGEVAQTDPDVVFLAEAFTRPAMMHELGQGGLPPELHLLHLAQHQGRARDLREAARRASAHYMRPNFFVNTPDILPEYLRARRPGGLRHPGGARRDAVTDLGRVLGVRAVRTPRRIARAARSTWIRRSTSCVPAIMPAPLPTGGRWRRCSPQLNKIRHAHPALHQLRNLHFHQVDNPDITAFSKRDAASGRHRPRRVHDQSRTTWREGTTSLDLPALGIDWDSGFRAIDLLDGTQYRVGPVQLRPARSAPPRRAHLPRASLLSERRVKAPDRKDM